ncbi:hypothetical protein HY498_03785 [Candidatus Woesearchaeota archaeon]|nr:hypothetical protein [Candidatus Woesearchaeota archaeon]
MIEKAVEQIEEVLRKPSMPSHYMIDLLTKLGGYDSLKSTPKSFISDILSELGSDRVLVVWMRNMLICGYKLVYSIEDGNETFITFQEHKKHRCKRDYTLIKYYTKDNLLSLLNNL